jgi:hypothetical protein
LKTQQEEHMASLKSLKDSIDLSSLDQLNTILAELIANGETRHAIIDSIKVLFEEAKAILNA